MKVKQDVYDQLLDAARSTAPLEACGLLAGEGDVVCRFYPLTNADASAEHFSMIPQEQFTAVKDMRKQGLKMLGIWHSHPATPARMSEEDQRLAFTPDVAYVILSLSEPDTPQLRAFTVDEGDVQEVDISVERY